MEKDDDIRLVKRENLLLKRQLIATDIERLKAIAALVEREIADFDAANATPDA